MKIDLIFGILIMISSCSIFGPPENKISIDIANQSKNRKAALFIKGGNATVDDSVHLTLCEFNCRISNKATGNIFIADTNYGRVSLNNSITLNWTGNDSLIVSFDKLLRVFKKEKMYQGVTIVYKEK